jgi:hypothetical protein
MKALDRGCRPCDIKIDVKGQFQNTSNEEVMDKIAKDFKTRVVVDQRGCLDNSGKLLQ